MTNVNVGIITTLWCIQPLAAAILDLFIYGEKIKSNHVFGIFLVLCSGLFISYSYKAAGGEVEVEVTDRVKYDPNFPKWVPVMFGVLTPVFFVTSGLFIKHLTSKRVGFDAMNISFSTTLSGSSVILIVGILWYWRVDAVFNKRLFFIGMFSSIFDTFGKACIQRAYSRGPAGPVSAFVEINNVFLIIFECCRLWKLPNWMEFMGFLFGFFGAIVLTVPDALLKLLTCGYCRKKN